jgi:hypothetical protein
MALLLVALAQAGDSAPMDSSAAARTAGRLRTVLCRGLIDIVCLALMG